MHLLVPPLAPGLEASSMRNGRVWARTDRALGLLSVARTQVILSPFATRCRLFTMNTSAFTPAAHMHISAQMSEYTVPTPSG